MLLGTGDCGLASGARRAASRAPRGCRARVHQRPSHAGHPSTCPGTGRDYGPSSARSRRRTRTVDPRSTSERDVQFVRGPDGHAGPAERVHRSGVRVDAGSGGLGCWSVVIGDWHGWPARRAAGLRASVREPACPAAFAGGVATWGAAVLAIGIWPDQTVAWVVLAALGLGSTLEDVAGLTLMQKLIPKHELGRAFGALYGVASGSGLAAGSLAAPVLISLLGLRGAMATSGAALVVLVLVLWGRVRHADSGHAGPRVTSTVHRARDGRLALNPAGRWHCVQHASYGSAIARSAIRAAVTMATCCRHGGASRSLQLGASTIAACKRTRDCRRWPSWSASGQPLVAHPDVA